MIKLRIDWRVSLVIDNKKNVAASHRLIPLLKLLQKQKVILQKKKYHYKGKFVLRNNWLLKRRQNQNQNQFKTWCKPINEKKLIVGFKTNAAKITTGEKYCELFE